MLSKTEIENVILENIFQRPSPDAANKIARQLNLGPGTVVLGEKVISITEGSQIRHLQIAPDGRSIVFVDPAFLK